MNDTPEAVIVVRSREVSDRGVLIPTLRPCKRAVATTSASVGCWTICKDSRPAHILFEGRGDM